MIASAKSDYEANLAQTYVHSNNSRIFQCISNIKGQDHYPIEMSYNDTTASYDSEIAEIFIGSFQMALPGGGIIRETTENYMWPNFGQSTTLSRVK